MSEIQDLIHATTMRAMHLGERQEQKRIVANIMSRVTDLMSCGKDDNCHELGTLIQCYIPEWVEVQTDE